jgi:hypothetical protein
LLIQLIVAIVTSASAEERAGPDSKLDRQITIHWTDIGVYMGARPEALKRPDEFLFKSLPKGTMEIFTSIHPQGQILIPMPPNEALPKSEAEWQALANKYAQGIKDRIEAGIKSGLTEFEIRTVQNITIKTGYWDPNQQERCVQFTRAFLDALSSVRNDFAKGFSVSVDAMVGSNGGLVATRAIPGLSTNPIDRLIIVDGRAYVMDTLNTYRAMKGNLIIINTGGDAPALKDMIANHDGAKSLKYLLPQLDVIYVDPKGMNIFTVAHISAMRPNTEMDMKFCLGDGYSPKARLTGETLRQYLLKPGGTQELFQKVTMKDPLQPGGVWIDPQPESIGKGGADIQERTLDSRPSEDSLSWPIPSPQGGGK